MTAPNNHAETAEVVLATLRRMADDRGLVAASVREIATAADLPTARTSVALGILRGKGRIERVQEGRGRPNGGTIHRVTA